MAEQYGPRNPLTMGRGDWNSVYNMDGSYRIKAPDKRGATLPSPSRGTAGPAFKASGQVTRSGNVLRFPQLSDRAYAEPKLRLPPLKLPPLFPSLDVSKPGGAMPQAMRTGIPPGIARTAMAGVRIGARFIPHIRLAMNVLDIAQTIYEFAPEQLHIPGVDFEPEIPAHHQKAFTSAATLGASTSCTCTGITPDVYDKYRWVVGIASDSCAGTPICANLQVPEQDGQPGGQVGNLAGKSLTKPNGSRWLVVGPSQSSGFRMGTRRWFWFPSSLNGWTNPWIPLVPEVPAVPEVPYIKRRVAMLPPEPVPKRARFPLTTFEPMLQLPHTRAPAPVPLPMWAIPLRRRNPFRVEQTETGNVVPKTDDPVDPPPDFPDPPVRARPPGRGVRERKVIMQAGGKTLRLVVKNVGRATEALDIIKCLWSALPRKYRRPTKGQPFGRQMLADLWANWQHVNMTEFAKCAIANEVEDRIIGGIGQYLKGASRRLGIGGSTGIGVQVGGWRRQELLNEVRELVPRKPASGKPWGSRSQYPVQYRRQDWHGLSSS